MIVTEIIKEYYMQDEEVDANVIQTVKEYLEDNGYDGLYCDVDDCSCEKEDLRPCRSDDFLNCEPYRR